MYYYGESPHTYFILLLTYTLLRALKSTFIAASSLLSEILIKGILFFFVFDIKWYYIQSQKWLYILLLYDKFWMLQINLKIIWIFISTGFISISLLCLLYLEYIYSRNIFEMWIFFKRKHHFSFHIFFNFYTKLLVTSNISVPMPTLFSGSWFLSWS